MIGGWGSLVSLGVGGEAFGFGGFWVWRVLWDEAFGLGGFCGVEVVGLWSSGGCLALE